jgi:hypothetical protein
VSWFDQINIFKRLGALEVTVADLKQGAMNLKQKVDQMSLDVTKIVADVAAQTTVIQSAVTLIQSLNAKITDLSSQLAAAIAANDPAAVAAVQAQLDQAAKDLEANTQALAAAVPQNTSG